MAKDYWVWKLYLTEKNGWDNASAWGPLLEKEANRIFRTREEAKEELDALREGWKDMAWDEWEGAREEEGNDEIEDEGFEIFYKEWAPQFAMRRCSAFEWLWSDDEAAIQKIVSWFGEIGPEDCPPEHREFLIRLYTQASDDASRLSNDELGRSSLTHTYAIQSGYWAHRADEVRSWPPYNGT
jgi:hypothetical protein